MRYGIGRLARGLLFSVVFFSAPASAETLNEALASAYSGNPALRAERARQRATDEQVPQALSGWRPTVTAQGDAGHNWSNTNTAPSTESDPAGVSISLAQPVFRGFKTINGTKAAEATVAAGRQDLLAVEQDILFRAVQAYMNVLRDRQIVAFRQKNASVLEEQLRAATARFEAGETTRTDTAQARARFSQSQSSLSGARANLAASVANYRRIVGHAPGTLKYPRVAAVPQSLDAALAVAGETNPDVLAAAFVEEASRHSVEVVKGDLLPSLTLEATASFRHDPGSNAHTSDSATIRGVLSVPLYEAGRVYSAVREAKHVASQRRLQVVETGRAVRESVESTWSFLAASQQTIAAAKAQVAAAELALDGVRQEYQVGSRTTLDVLDAEAEVVDARIVLVNAERDRVVAAYQLLAAIGRLTARDLGLGVTYYDAGRNYRAVRGKWIGTDADTIE
ncbi:MAG: TolC family outer membrane protein [Hyphomicrobiales bacterium]